MNLMVVRIVVLNNLSFDNIAINLTKTGIQVLGCIFLSFAFIVETQMAWDQELLPEPMTMSIAKYFL
ncbi:hypothetical protein AAJCM20276_06440 [Acetobacter aceti]|uniref:Uncharacterized protein n=1 Tax=Acetobacter aceti TaxID=435 RepID=A0A6S6PGB7_ACEAC|nr:hypothetical protein AAJCM20276_06440 [Acetobacter aceti]